MMLHFPQGLVEVRQQMLGSVVTLAAYDTCDSKWKLYPVTIRIEMATAEESRNRDAKGLSQTFRKSTEEAHREKPQDTDTHSDRRESTETRS